MRRLLFVDHVDRILGGAEINLAELLEDPPVRRGWAATCAVDPGGPLARRLSALGIDRRDFRLSTAARQFRVVGRRFSWSAGLRRWRELQQASGALGAIIAELRPEAVVSCTNKDHFCAVAACRRSATPSIWWINDIVSPEFFPWTVRRMFCFQGRRASRLVAVSNCAGKALVREGLPESRVRIIYNGISPAAYQPQPRGHLRRRHHLPDAEPLIGVVGRYTPWKGQDFFLRIARAWASQGRPGRFVLIGHAFNEDQPFEAGLRAFVDRHGLADRVRFIPFESPVAAALSDLDVLLHTSVRPEPFGRVIIEAMAAGVPVIGARSGGVPEIVVPGETGLLAAPGDLEEYLQRLRELLGSVELQARFRAAGQREVQARFSLERVRQDWERLFGELAGATADSNQSRG